MVRASSASRDGERVSRPRVRLRYVLLAVLAVVLVRAASPRVEAWWELQSAGPALADYAACMGGPTAPAALKESPEQYLVLLRRRVIAAPADSAPFAACARFAAKLPGSQPESRLQRAEAGAFVEYGLSGAGVSVAGDSDTREITLELLALTTEPVIDLGRRAWPFVRGSVLGRIQPSSPAQATPHPLAAPHPLQGAGLPQWDAWYRSTTVESDGIWLAYGHGANLAVFRSRDGGLRWERRSQSAQAVAAVRERCVADDTRRSFVFSTDEVGDNITVRSLDPEGSLVGEQPVASSDHSIVGAGCGAGSVSVLLRASEGDPGTLVTCAHGGECKPMRSPSLATSRWIQPRLTDVARIGRTTIVAAETSGIVRVGSTHDDGRMWTPLTVAYDPVESAVGGQARPPRRLLVVGKRLLFYSESTGPNGPCSVVVSDDLGASWNGAR